jgi:pantothenate kinase
MPVVKNLAPYVARAAALSDGHRRVVLAIAGPPGAGKSALAQHLVDKIDGAARFPMDGFHLSDERLAEAGLLDRKGAPETFDSEGYVDLLRNVVHQPDEEWKVPSFDHSAGVSVPDALSIPSSVQLIVAEGNYLLLRVGEWAAIRELCEETWFLDVKTDVERKRLVARQVAKGKSPDEAGEWVDRSDMANADLIRAYSAPGTCFLMLEEGAL